VNSPLTPTGTLYFIYTLYRLIKKTADRFINLSVYLYYFTQYFILQLKIRSAQIIVLYLMHPGNSLVKGKYFIDWPNGYKEYKAKKEDCGYEPLSSSLVSRTL